MVRTKVSSTETIHRDAKKKTLTIVPLTHEQIKLKLSITLGATDEELGLIMAVAQASFHDDDDFSFSRLGRRILAKKQKLIDLIGDGLLTTEALELLFPLPTGLSDSMIFTEEHRRIRDGSGLRSNEQYGKGINSKASEKLMIGVESRLI